MEQLLGTYLWECHVTFTTGNKIADEGGYDVFEAWAKLIQVMGLLKADSLSWSAYLLRVW
jgi:hypothetical protein